MILASSYVNVMLLSFCHKLHPTFAKLSAASFPGMSQCDDIHCIATLAYLTHCSSKFVEILVSVALYGSNYKQSISQEHHIFPHLFLCH
jgi:hypothetical protein